jgi:hypothetical protein
VNRPSYFRRTTWHNLARILQRHLEENPNHQDNLTIVPNGTKWHQQTYQRLPGKEQGYSLRSPESQSQQMDILGWLVEGRNIKINLVRATKTTRWPKEPRGVRRMDNTSEILKCQGSLIPEFRNITRSPIEAARKGKSCKWMWECVSIANRLINIITRDSVLACLDLGKLFGLEEDTSAYGLDMTLFQRRENRQKRSMDYFSVAPRRAG